MIIGFFADFHATNETPRCRTDNYPEVQKAKFLQILDIFDMAGCKHVLFAGDFWDHTKVPYKTVNWYLETVVSRWCGCPIHSVAGQHDQINHTMKLENSPYMTMVAGGAFIHLSSTPKTYKDPVTDQNIHIYGKSWGAEIPEIADKDAFNILVNHDTLVVEKLWEGQKNPKYADKFVKENQFNLVVCGDNHNPFVTRYRSRLLVMCGSVCRSTVDQADYQPFVYTFDTATKKLSEHKIKIEPGVIKHIEHKEKKKNKLDLEKFVSLLDKRTISRDFISATLEQSALLKNKAVKREISDIITAVTGR
jgi:DNA repair exonuclease SbcCD nuclease subunit